MHVLTKPALTHPTSLPVTARLARLADATARSGGWLAPGFSSSTAYIHLSQGLVCVFDADPPNADAQGLTHQQVGAAGMSVHQVWNAAADQLAKRAHRPHGIEFMVRCPTAQLGADRPLPRGYEVDGHGVPAAAWLAHPKTFTVLHRHFESVMEPTCGLVYASRDLKELFVFDASVEQVAAACGARAVLTYSVGFPLLLDT